MRAAHLVLALGLAVGTTQARAGPMEDTSLGGAVFTGPTSGHASAFFVNPAALGFTGRGWHLHLGGSARLSSISIDRRAVGLDGSLGQGESVNNHTLSPGGIIALYRSFQDDAARFGGSLYAPTFQRFPAGEDALGYHSLGGQIAQGMLTLAGSYRFGNRLMVGVGFSLGYSAIRLKFYRDSVLEGGSDSVTGTNSDCGGSPCGFENPEARERYDVDSQFELGDLFAARNFSASIGAAVRVRGNSWLGLGYVALPGAFDKLTLSGNATVTQSPRDGGQTDTAKAEIGFRMAQMLFLGYRRPAFDSFDLVTDIRWQDWSRHDEFDIRLYGGARAPETPEWMPRYRGMQDVWRLSAGLESNDQEQYRLGARLRFETSAVDDDAHSPMQVAGSNLTLATGAELRLADHWVLNAGYEITWFPSTDVSDSAFDPRDQVACVDSEYDFDQCGASRDGRALSTAAGNYQHLQHGLVLSLRYDSL